MPNYRVVNVTDSIYLFIYLLCVSETSNVRVVDTGA